jgi:hypothetical protein
MHRVYFFGLSCVILFSSVALNAADPKAPAFTNAKEAGVDYELQGEYVGVVKSDEGEKKIGVQVIALGDGKFRAVGYIGGLPGDGWSKGDKSHSAEGQLQDGVVRFAGEDSDIRAELRDASITVFAGSTKVAEFSKTLRQSPTLGAKPPQGAIVLFDGSDVEQWENGKLVDDKWLAANNVATKKAFGDHSFHVEFRTPFMPKSSGQARGNSGVYVQSRYEVQVLDSFGLEGKNNECGGIYSISEPAVNMCLPPLTWQTYDIDFTAARYDDAGTKTKNARVTVKHNGVVIHDDVELTHGTPGRHPEGPKPDGLFFQDHGNPVVFRNIWIVEK